MVTRLSSVFCRFQCDMLNKTYRLFFMLIFIALAFACSKENKTGVLPSVNLIQDHSLISNDTSISPGVQMNFGIDINEGDFHVTEFLIRVTADSSRVYFDTGMFVSTCKLYKSFTKSFDDNETWEFIVRDRYGQSNSLTLKINNDSLLGYGQIDILSNIILGAQNNSNEGGFLSLSNFQNFTLTEAKIDQQIIDMVYYFGEDANTIASPGANIEAGIFDEASAPITWDIRNTTLYIYTYISSQEFDNIQNDSLLLISYIEGEGKRKAKNLMPGDVFSFKTQDSRFGLFKVNDVVGESEGTISIDLKIQQKQGQ